MTSMQEPTFLMLSALAPRPLYGYAVIQEVETLSQGRVRLRPGTLYAALDRLTEDGLVEVDHEEIVEGRLRRYYRLTDGGAAALATAIGHLEANSQVAAERLRTRSLQIAPAHA